MFENTVKWLVFILAIYLAFNAVVSVNTPLKRKTYIVQMDRSAKPGYFTSHLEWYSSKVQSVLSKPEIEGQADEEDRIIYSYETAFHGVAAKLNDEEAERLEEEDGVVALFPETKYQLHTTRSPMFLGLEPEDSTSVWSEKVADHDVIVGVLDTGVFPESESFNDTGMSPVTLSGVSLYKGRRILSTGKQYPLVYMGGNSSSLDPSSLCLEGTLNPRVVAGKIVICDRGISPRVEKGQVAKQAGAVGMILANTAANGEELVADCHLLPAVAVGEKEGKLIKSYASTSRNATATLAFLGTRLGIRPSPVVAAFSSRGPNLLTLEILKPDIVAPGVNILAAWTGELGPSSLPTDHRRVEFNILSGTSMSCPHVSGIAALLKARHPEWSPAAIKSALMTTAYVHDNTHHPLKDASVATPSTPFDHGAGHVNPMKALDPGLIYDLEPQDYFDFLCTQKLTPSQLKVFGKFANRSCRHSLANPGDLNYPSMSAVFPEDTSIKVLTLHRTVTNVGPPTSTYHVVISPFKGATVKVEPEVLNFTRKNQKLSYRIIFTTKIRQTMPEFGGLVWKDGARKVRSPIAITWLTPLT
ncbi:hypothetical protein OIU78_016456 [Salix suchowensis]|nr:hypothetical protein OIU78_016456 [Salix suchowensis]